MMKKEMIAMILAGGQGSRLKLLTKNIAKPAVPFGGKYRIIDFPLSNCTNSGIDTVGILVQYKPKALNSYIGIGASWDLNRNFGGVSILPPYMQEDGGWWYKGTANSIYQNIDFIDDYDPEYVLILSGDHIYKMDYNKMLEYHKSRNADATIAVLNVSLEEASRFGIMNVKNEDEIYEFEEKPAHPKSTLASMGIYIFNWKVLKQALIEDEANEKSSNDFGKDIIPKLLGENKKLIAYPFEGYWKDVGTVESLWEANMDLLGEEPKFDIFDKNWRIFSKSTNKPSQVIGDNAVIANSLVTEGCVIKGTVENSILFQGVLVEEGAVIKDSVIMCDSVIKKNSVVERAICGRHVVVEEDKKVIGGKEIALIEEDRIVTEDVK
ncbi:glucose-1-phosphate adenylyltransferase [Fusobacterium perfoetens]|uniref:glucose-1-phosphate adenylyltransferase n=1 Tax=Fusobacterium perfoetens TaxID=852 RepID=UPI00047F7895|nr:glucose-1-phosphate adenylyltransferase [Fusobacterium perfoetens]MDY3238174.1 glucose-1-phosphate adenylyltransferase [Fusobacterium perfoetens]